eukprot:m.112043 g.112043  ORF g.112043 m.112043 type:complete len:942 (+) comp28164_c0_seq1:154-2979(+)
MENVSPSTHTSRRRSSTQSVDSLFSDITNSMANENGVTRPQSRAKSPLVQGTSTALGQVQVQCDDYVRITSEIAKEKRIIEGAANLTKAAKKDKKIKKQAAQMRGAAEVKLRLYNRELTQILAQQTPPRQFTTPQSQPKSRRQSSNLGTPLSPPALQRSQQCLSRSPSPHVPGVIGLESPVMNKSANLDRLQKLLVIEEKVNDGAENLLNAYTLKKKGAKVADSLMQHASNLVTQSKNKMDFLKTEILREIRCPAGTPDRVLSSNYDSEKRIYETRRRIEIETSLELGATRISGNPNVDRKILAEAKITLFESSNKLRLLKAASDRHRSLQADDSSTVVPAFATLSFGQDDVTTDSQTSLPPRISPSLAELTGRFHVHVMQAEGLYMDPAVNPDTKIEPFVVIKIGSTASARTKPWVKPFTFPNWDQQLVLEFHRGRECEIHYYSDRETMCGVQFLKLEDFIDGNAHVLKLPMEPQGWVKIEARFENALISPRKRKPVSKTLQRAKDVWRIKRVRGTKMIRPTDMGMGIATWTRILREDTVMKEKSVQTRMSRDDTDGDNRFQSLLLVETGIDSPRVPIPKKRNMTLTETPTKTECGFTHRNLKMDDFTVLSILGRGHFGKVLLAERKHSSQLAAIKCLKKAEILARDEIDSMVTERNVFKTINAGSHPFLVSLYATFQTDTHICYVMEYTPGGDLLSHIQHQIFDEKRACFYAACVVLGLKFLHENEIIYRDLKLDNLLLDKQGYLKVADYGLCKENMSYGDRTSTFCGTPEFIAPEVLTQNDYTIAVDWWGVGVLIFEMLVGEAPFPGETEEQIFEAIVHDEVRYPHHLSISTTNIVRKLLQKNPSKRLGAGPADAGDVMKHVYFRNMDWDKLMAKKLRAPFVPRLAGNKDLSHFDPEFTGEDIAFTPTTGHALTKAEQSVFEGFSFTENWLGRRETTV